MANKYSQEKDSKPEGHNKELIYDLRRIPNFALVSISNFFNKVVVFIKNIPAYLYKIPATIRSTPGIIKKWLLKKRKVKKYRSFRLQKKIKPEARYIPTVRLLFWQSIKFILKNSRTFFLVGLIYLLIYILLLKAPATDISIYDIKSSVSDAMGVGDNNGWTTTLATLGTVLGFSSMNQANSSKAAISTILISLVYIWAIRQISNGHKIKARDAYYQGLAPLFSTLILIIIATVQLLPFAVASFIYTIARTGGLFVTGFEDMAVFSIVAIMALLSFFLITPTVIAFYIATLPGMYPINALRSAKRLVQFQRFVVFRRLLALPLILGALYLLILLLTIRIVPSVTVYFAEGFQFVALPIAHVYLYRLYRALI